MLQIYNRMLLIGNWIYSLDCVIMLQIHIRMILIGNWIYSLDCVIMLQIHIRMILIGNWIYSLDCVIMLQIHIRLLSTITVITAAMVIMTDIYIFSQDCVITLHNQSSHPVTSLSLRLDARNDVRGQSRSKVLCFSENVVICSFGTSFLFFFFFFFFFCLLVCLFRFLSGLFFLCLAFLFISCLFVCFFLFISFCVCFSCPSFSLVFTFFGRWFELSTLLIIIIIIAFKGAIRDFLQSPHSATNCLQHVRSKWPGRNHVQITCNTSSAYHVQVSCYVPLGTKGQLSY